METAVTGDKHKYVLSTYTIEEVGCSPGHDVCVNRLDRPAPVLLSHARDLGQHRHRPVQVPQVYLALGHLLPRPHVLQDGGRTQVGRPLVEGGRLPRPVRAIAALPRRVRVHGPERVRHLQAEPRRPFSLVALLQRADGVVVRVQGWKRVRRYIIVLLLL